MRLTQIVRPLTAFLFSIGLVACGGSSPTATPQTPKVAEAAADPSCPVTVPGTSVSVEDTDSGAALVFVTTSDATEVRKRVAAMAQMHNEQHASMGPLPDGSAHPGDGAHAGHDMGEHAGHDMSGAGHDMSRGGEHAGHAGGMIGVHSKATAADIEGGARLVFTANASDVATLQGELRMHAQHMAGGSCHMGQH